MTRAGPDHFALWLDTAMNNRGWGNRDLASKVGVHESMVSRWRRGASRPGLDAAQRIGAALGEDPLRVAATAGHELMGVEPLPMPPPTAERAKIRRELEKIRGLQEEDIAAGLRSWDARHGLQ